ncbi:MAG: glycosyltransferase [Anaerolineae bacterium]
MTDCVFVIGGWPLSRDASGGASPLSVSHLELLAAAGLSVTVLALDHDTPPAAPAAAQVHTLAIQRGRSMATLLSPYSVRASTMHALRDRIAADRPDLVWAESLRPAALAAAAAYNAPLVYAHYDWNWKIKALRSPERANGLRGKVRFWHRRRFEESLVRRAAGVVSGSHSELESIRAVGARHTAYLPPTYSRWAWPRPTSDPPRVVHVGGMATTANRIGMERFMRVVWPGLPRATPLWVIGSLRGISAVLQDDLSSAGAQMPGFVPDLCPVLRPYDIHIIPWEHDTGTRTRIPLVLNAGQVIVAMREAAAGSPEVVHDENAVLVDTLEEMAPAITALLADAARRRRLGEAARAAFETHFTQEALLPRLTAFLERVLPLRLPEQT